MNNLVTAYGSASAVACGVGNAVRPSLGDEGNGNIAFGVRISVSGAGETTAVGFVNETGGVRNTVVGVHNITSGGNRNAVMGFANSAGSDAGVVIGESNFIQRDSDYSVAIGSGSDITGWNSIAIGNHATIGDWPTRERADNAIALGNDANVQLTGAVAIGAGATATAANTGAYKINGGSIAGQGAPGTVFSVGAAGSERQIQNVAAGVISATSTDAVNGSQLYAVGTQVNLNSADIATLRSEAFAGTAMAIAMTGGALPPGATSSLTLNVGAYKGEAAFAASLNHLVSPNVVLNGALALSTAHGDVGARMGLSIGW